MVGSLAERALIATALVWVGTVLGVAFIAVPAQFAAAGLERVVAFDITRQVFDRFAMVQLGVGLLALVLAALARPPMLVWSLLGLVWVILAVESAWLLPALDARVATLLRGEPLPSGPWHGLFVTAVSVKLPLLATIAGRLLWPRQTS